MKIGKNVPAHREHNDNAIVSVAVGADGVFWSCGAEPPPAAKPRTLPALMGGLLPGMESALSVTLCSFPTT